MTVLKGNKCLHRNSFHEKKLKTEEKAVFKIEWQKGVIRELNPGPRAP